jgi:SAM-dependent methyltransferase
MTQFNNNFWDERYSTEEYVYGKAPNEFFEKHLSKLKPGRLLLPGEGEGRNAVFAARLGWQVDATDQSIVAKSKAEKLANEFGVKINYSVCDINNYVFHENCYDAAAIIFFHLPGDIRSDINKKIFKSLKPDGTLILEMFNKGQLGRETGGPQDSDMLYSTEDIERDFSSLTTILLESKIITLDEGPKHSGEASVIRYIGIKNL